MQTDALKKFAADLKNSREAKEISLQYISNRTKIDIKYLYDIENGNFEVLPDLYIRAFIKEYALLIDLDVKVVLNNYELAKKGIVEEKIDVTQKKESEITANKDAPMFDEEKEFIKTKSEEKTVKEKNIEKNNATKFDLRNAIKNNLFPISALLVIILLGLIYILFIKESSPEIITETVVKETENDARFEIDSTSMISNEPVKDDSLRLLLSASARVWVKILCDRKEVFQGFVDKDESINYKASQEYRVVVGNAGFINIFLNNKELKLEGNRGEIRNYIINADTVKSYLISPPARNENRTSKQN